MKKLCIILSIFLTAGCNPYKSGSEISSSRSIAPVELTPKEVLDQQLYQLKQIYSISENNFDTSSGLINEASILNNELILDNPSNQNQHLDTLISVKDLSKYSLSIWFKTNDPNKVQMIFWQGKNDQNGWGAGADNINFSEFHVGLNHWNNTLAESISAFYGYNESALAPSAVPTGFPISRNPTTGTFDLLGNPYQIDTNYHHLIITVNKTASLVEMKTYIDGVLQNQGVGAQLDNSMWNSNLLVGKSGADGQRNFTGKLSKFLALNKVLTPEEVNLIYNAQK